ncbi:MAG: GFA family protein [Hyphomicrobiaceae bacterium]|nr:GFA family protein [Hyphomicrobiaceae bacterium]
MTGTSTSEITGRCLCGAISFTATAKVDQDGKVAVGACHCGMCRTWSGGVLLAVDEASDLRVDGEDRLAVYKSSDWGERCFCRTCGTNLFWRSPSLGVLAIMAGALDDQSGLSLTKQIFIDEKPAHFSFAEPTQTYTGEEFVKLMTSGGSGS